MKILLCTFALLVAVPVLAASAPATVGGVDHVGLTVTNLDASAEFFTQALGFKIRGRDKGYPAVFLSNGEITVTLWRVSDRIKAVPFNRKQNVGLHHLAFRVASFEELDTVYQRVKEVPGVRIEFAPELFYGGPAKHMMIREPSGNRLEFIHRPPETGS